MASSDMAFLIPHSYNLHSRNKQPSEKDGRRCSPSWLRHCTVVPNEEAGRLQRFSKGKHVERPRKPQETGGTTAQSDAAKIKEILKSELECLICRCLDDAIHTESSADIWLVVAVSLLGLRSKVEGTCHTVVLHAA
ncbi:hypothetical protein BDN71DRAFT_1436210 [Pleurotus eryngii]|uniref:Uncharacterized protein n=1 Tax=Pleurotus eryngii TaxID=5323 RepID=A0A9P6DA46_PLEER|nr:hypothetical protein BDN71DRAFT_1436210 [Pleurotus eryngii]